MRKLIRHILKEETQGKELTSREIKILKRLNKIGLDDTKLHEVYKQLTIGWGVNDIKAQNLTLLFKLNYMDDADYEEIITPDRGENIPEDIRETQKALAESLYGVNPLLFEYKGSEGRLDKYGSIFLNYSMHYVGKEKDVIDLAYDVILEGITELYNYEDYIVLGDLDVEDKARELAKLNWGHDDLMDLISEAGLYHHIEDLEDDYNERIEEAEEAGDDELANRLRGEFNEAYDELVEELGPRAYDELVDDTTDEYITDIHDNPAEFLDEKGEDIQYMVDMGELLIDHDKLREDLHEGDMWEDAVGGTRHDVFMYDDKVYRTWID